MRAELSGDVTPTPYVRITGTLGQLRLDSMATNVREPMSWVVDGYRSLPVSLLKTASNEVRYRREYITQCQIENASLPLREDTSGHLLVLPAKRGHIRHRGARPRWDRWGRHENAIFVGAPAWDKMHLTHAYGVKAARQRRLE